MGVVQIGAGGTAELPTGAERATSRRAVGPMVAGVFEVFQSLRAVAAAATGDRSRSGREIVKSGIVNLESEICGIIDFR